MNDQPATPANVEDVGQPKREASLAAPTLLGAMYRGSDGAMTCALCHCEMEWEGCSSCGGEGYHDAYEDDPNFYDPGDTVDCCTCSGRGGSWWCETKDCPTKEGWKKIKAPNVRVSESGGNKPTT